MPLGNNISTVMKGPTQVDRIMKGTQVVWENFKPVEGLVFRGTYNNESDRTNYTYSNAPIGAASASRWVLACFSSSQDSASVTSATIGGVTASLVQNPSSHAMLAIAWLLVPSGTTASVRFDANKTISNGQIHVYTFSGGTGLAVRDSASDYSKTATKTLSDISVSAGGLVIGMVGGKGMAATNPSHSWNGVDSAVRDSFTLGEFGHGFSCGHVLASETSTSRDYTIAMNGTVSLSDSRYVVSFDPIA